MAITKFLARDLTIGIFSIGSGSGGPGSGDTPIAIGGLNSLTHSPSTDKADTTTFASDGRPEHMVAQRGDEWSLAGFTLEDVLTGTRDAGQAAVEALAQLMGLDSLEWFVITSPGGNTITFLASAEVNLAGGGNNDAAAWSAKLTISGPVLYA